MHPYTTRMISFLGDRSPLEVLAASPARLEELYKSLQRAAGLDQSYEPGKWTAAELFAHLADVEMVLGFRIRQALAEPNHTIQPMDQDAWAQPYKRQDPALAVKSFAALRAWNLSLIRLFTEEDLRRPVMHPERGEESLGIMVKMLAGHDLNHQAQLQRIRDLVAGGTPARAAN